MNLPGVIECVGPGGGTLRFENPQGIYSVNRYQSLWLATTAVYETMHYAAEVVRPVSALRVWEPCCGGGPVAILLKAAGVGFVQASDINQHALDACRRNAEINGLHIDASMTADLLDLPCDPPFDLIVCNPPCRPSGFCPPSLEPGMRLAIDGGPDGVEFFLALIEGARRCLVPGGRLVVVLASSSQFLKVQASLRENFPNAWRVSLNSPVAQPFEELGTERADLLVRAHEERSVIAWPGCDGRIWRLSWVIVATNVANPTAKPCEGRLFYRNHSYDIHDPAYVETVSHFERLS